MWTDKQKQELIRTGRVKGYEGHHITSVARNGVQSAENADKFKFVSRDQHLAEHGVNFRNSTKGPLVERTFVGAFFANLEESERITNEEMEVPAMSGRDSPAALINPINNVIEIAEAVNAVEQ